MRPQSDPPQHVDLLTHLHAESGQVTKPVSVPSDYKYQLCMYIFLSLNLTILIWKCRRVCYVCRLSLGSSTVCISFTIYSEKRAVLIQYDPRWYPRCQAQIFALFLELDETVNTLWSFFGARISGHRKQTFAKIHHRNPRALWSHLTKSDQILLL